MHFRRRKKSHLTLSIAPLVDIVFLLLIFFLLSSSYVQPSIKLNLPEAKNKETAQKQEIVVTVDKTGTIYLNREPVAFDELSERLGNLMKTTPQREIIFRGDRTIAYDLFVRIMDTAKRAGAEDIHISHQYERSVHQ
ncbi:MAG: biopolymer transporter ExbD [Pseudomonadota bacterium]